MSVDNNVIRVGRGIQWLLLSLVPGTALAVLLSMKPPLAFDRLGVGSLEEVLLTTGRGLGLVLAAWIVITQLLYTLAVFTRADWMAEVLRPITLPIIRRIAAGAAAITISFGSVTAVAQTAPQPTIIVVDEGTTGGLRQEATPTPVLQPLAEHEFVEPCVSMEPEAWCPGTIFGASPASTWRSF